MSAAPSSPSGPDAADLARTAVRRARTTAFHLHNEYDVSINGQGHTSLTLDGPYDFARKVGRFAMTGAAAGTSQRFTEVLTPATLYFAIATTNYALPRTGSTEVTTPLRTPGNQPEYLFPLVESAQDWHRGSTESANGVPATHLVGTLTTAALERMSAAKLDALYGQLKADERTVDVYVDEHGKLLRILLTVGNPLESTVRSQIEFTAQRGRIDTSVPAGPLTHVPTLTGVVPG